MEKSKTFTEAPQIANKGVPCLCFAIKQSEILQHLKFEIFSFFVVLGYQDSVHPENNNFEYFEFYGKLLDLVILYLFHIHTKVYQDPVSPPYNNNFYH